MQFVLYFIRQVYKQWFLIFVAIIGLVSGILQIFPLEIKSSSTNLVILISCFLISIIVTLIIYQIKHIPDDELWILEQTVDKPTIAFPYQQSFLRPANLLARSHYGKGAVNYTTVQKWYEKNPYLLTVLTDSHNKFVGYFDILPLNSTFGKDLVSGIAMEKDIKHNCILPISEMRDAEYIYIAGISIKDQVTQTGRKYGAILIYAAMIYIETFYNLANPKKIYAIAATDCGKNILEKLKFQIESDESNRKDKLDLYSRFVTQNEIDFYKNKFAFCEDKFDFSNYKKALIN